jgi:hypothetical protein
MNNKYTQRQELLRYRMNCILTRSQDIAKGLLGGPRPGQLGKVGTVAGSKRFFSFSKCEFGFLGLTEHLIAWVKVLITLVKTARK